MRRPAKHFTRKSLKRIGLTALVSVLTIATFNSLPSQIEGIEVVSRKASASNRQATVTKVNGKVSQIADDVTAKVTEKGLLVDFSKFKNELLSDGMAFGKTTVRVTYKSDAVHSFDTVLTEEASDFTLAQLCPGVTYKIEILSKIAKDSESGEVYAYVLFVADGEYDSSQVSPSPQIKSDNLSTQSSTQSSSDSHSNTHSSASSQSSSSTLKTPTISLVELDNKCLDVKLSGVDRKATHAEYNIYARNTKGKYTNPKTVVCPIGNTQISRNFNPNAMCSVKSRVFYEERGKKVYSKWSSAKFFIAQPEIVKKKTKNNRTVFTATWKPVKGADSYDIYLGKSATKGVVKIQSTNKTTFTISKTKSNKSNLASKKYYCIVAKGKSPDGKTIHSCKTK